jgi:hypothetical protein
MHSNSLFHENFSKHIFTLTRLEKECTYFLFKSDGFLLKRGQPCI